MKVQEIKEHEDGSATVLIEEMTPEEVQVLIQEGFKAMLMRYIAEMEEDNKKAALFKPKSSYFESNE
jgi:hypothetical protein